MFVEFHQLPNNARVWVYTADRMLSDIELGLISQKLESFADSWQSHQKDIKASFIIIENRFVIIAADESYNDISGCGIDKSIHIVQELESELGILLTGKSLVIFEKQGKQIQFPYNKIKEAVSMGVIEPNTFFFNTLVNNVAALANEFKIESSQGWVKKYFDFARID